MRTIECDVLVVGAGVAGLNCALHLPQDKTVFVACKGGLKQSNSFLAQGGICVQYDKKDFEPYFEDTMRAGHYENSPEAVRCMIENSREVIDELLAHGVRFARKQDGSLAYTREGAHSRPRILFHADCTGKEITSHLLKSALKRKNLQFYPYTTMLDIVEDGERCVGAVMRDNRSGEVYGVRAGATVLATGGVGGLYRHSTNFRILTGDGLAVCLKHGVKVDHANYVQIHPTTLYTKGRGRRFLISESVRGEGAVILNAKGERFVDELLPRDVVTQAIRKQMQEEGSNFVRLDLSTVRGGEETLRTHFPSIVKRCREEGYDVPKQPVPIVPAQHYFMGGIRSDLFGRTTMKGLYAVGETCCNGVHGKNRLASNSLLESLVFASRAAKDMASNLHTGAKNAFYNLDEKDYQPVRALEKEYQTAVKKEINSEE